MARPIKRGIDYFPWDVDSLRDMKVRKIMRANGPASVAVLICLLGNIYGDEGYYMKWDEDARFLISDDVGVKESYVDAVVQKAIKVGFFDSDMYAGRGILTSRGIQQRYKTASAQRKENDLDPDIDLINGVNPPDNPVNDGDNPTQGDVSTPGSTQSKVKESKAKNKRDSRQPRKRVYPDDSPEMGEAEYLWSKIKGNNPEHRKPNMQQWADDIRKMHELDQRPFDKIHKMIDWSQRDDFWSTNILSAAKLRAKYDTMAAQANSKWQARNAPRKPRTPQPPWADPNYKSPAAEPTNPETRAKLDAEMAKLRANREKRKENAT